MPSPINNHSQYRPIWPGEELVEEASPTGNNNLSPPTATTALIPHNRAFVDRRPVHQRANTAHTRPAREASTTPNRTLPVTGVWRVGVEAWVRSAMFSRGGERLGREWARDAMSRENPRLQGGLPGLLDLGHSHLSSLPPMYPAWVTHLSATNNRLRTLSNSLPTRLERLHLDRNQLRELPNSLPANLQTLTVSHNRLAEIPRNLPANLRMLNLSNNELIAFPEQLPQNLTTLNLRNNLIEELPDSVIRYIEGMNGGRVDLRGNPLSFNALISLNDMIRQPNYQGPEILGPGLMETYLAQWEQWASEQQSGSEQRDEAIRQLRTWMASNLPALNALENDTALDLIELDLQSLPGNLPHNLNQLNIQNNALAELPENLPNSITRLNASNNRLTSLPRYLPNSLRLLNARNNNIMRLPDDLPSRLDHLDIANNDLTQLPERLPGTLNLLDAANNNLTRLPTNLPDTLSHLDVGNNQITNLPQRLPRMLRYLDARGNQLHTLSHNHLYTPLGGDLMLIVTGNPLTQTTINQLNILRNDPNYNGAAVHYTEYRAGRPRNVVLSPNNTSHAARSNGANRPLSPHPDIENMEPIQPPILNSVPATPAAELGRVAAGWVVKPYTQAEATKQLWQGFIREPGAQQFAEFLNQLHQTVNANDPMFRRDVANWLTQLEKDPQLRKETFAVSIGATESCQDRISHTFNAMTKLSMAASVSRGNYDNHLPELFKLARGMYRLEKLEEIARETTAALVEVFNEDRVDEIEVYLGYQVMLREPLGLPISTRDMAFFRCARLTQLDLKQAHTRVLTAERTEFANYLSTNFAPWHSVIQRLAPEMHEEAQTELIDAMGSEFTRRVNTRLQDMAMLNEADAEREVGVQVKNEIAREVYGQLTRDFLASKGMLNLLQLPT